MRHQEPVVCALQGGKLGQPLHRGVLAHPHVEEHPHGLLAAPLQPQQSPDQRGIALQHQRAHVLGAGNAHQVQMAHRGQQRRVPLLLRWGRDAGVERLDRQPLLEQPAGQAVRPQHHLVGQRQVGTVQDPGPLQGRGIGPDRVPVERPQVDGPIRDHLAQGSGAARDRAAAPRSPGRFPGSTRVRDWRRRRQPVAPAARPSYTRPPDRASQASCPRCPGAGGRR